MRAGDKNMGAGLVTVGVRVQRFGKEGSYRGMRLGYGRREKAKELYCGLGSGYGGVESRILGWRRRYRGLRWSYGELELRVEVRAGV